MKRKNLILLSAIGATSLLCGCMAWQVPKTTIAGSIGGKPFYLSSPKNTTLSGLQVTAATNGTVSISVSNLTAQMDPNVITTTADAQVKMINAVAASVAGAVGTATAAAAKTP
jgi:uncharacterized membrane protein